jgi:hypothetical protein
MKLCMFSPTERDLPRGWPGRIDGERVVQLAAQTLQSFFASGSSAREHAEYPLEEVVLRAPVLEPPSVRVFEDESTFAFANPTAIRSPGSFVTRVEGPLDVITRRAAIVGLDGAIGGWTGFAEFRAPELAAPKDRDFALMLGPVVDTELEDRFDWGAARMLAEQNTRLRPGEILAGPVVAIHQDVASGALQLSFDGVGELTAFVG